MRNKIKKRSGFLMAVIAILAMGLISIIAVVFAFAYSADRSGAMSGSGTIERESGSPDEEPPVAVPPSGPCAERIIKIASEGVGAHEEGDNRGPRNNPAKNQGITPDYKHGSGNSDAWCGYFASWVLRLAGDKIPTTPCAANVYHYYKGKGQAFTVDSVKSGQNTPQAGDIFVKARGGTVMRCGAGHVGLVASYSNGTVYTIEGNSSNRVRRGSYRLDQLYGFGRPQCN